VLEHSLRSGGTHREVLPALSDSQENAEADIQVDEAWRLAKNADVRERLSF